MVNYYLPDCLAAKKGAAFSDSSRYQIFSISLDKTKRSSTIHDDAFYPQGYQTSS